MSTQPLVSVVTPVHNTVRYLDECIRSVRAQTYANWEYVVLDNASTDGSLELARRHAAEDTRIRVVHFDELVDQVPNYNRALRQISPHSRYVKMLEADNWLFPNCLAEMVALAEANPSVSVVSSYNSTESRLRLTGLPLARTVVDGREAARLHLAGQAYWFGAPTTVMMRADAVRARDPFYAEDGVVAEDLSACFDLLHEHDFGFVHQVLTFVRTENESILSRIKGFDGQYLDRVVMLERHGRSFFDAPALSATRASIWGEYYRALARGVLGRKGEAFWAFHRGSLAAAGLDYSRSRLAVAVVGECARMALQPSRWFSPLRSNRS